MNIAETIINLVRLRLHLVETITYAADEIAAIDRKISILGSQELEADLIESEKKAAEAVTKGKSHCRGARYDILKANERNARRKARQAYDRTR
jgi:hypothetical protein